MLEISRDMNTSEDTKIEPDLFQYYIRGVAELLSGDDFSPSSANSQLVGAGSGSFRVKVVMKEDDEKNRSVGFCSLFCNAVGNGLSSSEKARLTSMLRQSVIALTQEVNEMFDPVFAMNRLRNLLVPTKTCGNYQDTKCEDETENRATKRQKVLSSSPSVNGHLNGSLNEQKGVAKQDESLTRCDNKECAKYSKTDNNTLKSNLDESKSLCGDCLKQSNELFLGSSSRDNKENGEVNDDLQVLLVNRGPKVVEKMEKHSAELTATLVHMEEKLEELLDVIISSCRPMTLAEKHQLRSLIQKLPPKNLNRVVEIIHRGKPPEKKKSTDDINVDLQHEDNLTLWRIYFYVKAVENAQKLS